MINLDMVGRLAGGSLLVELTASAERYRALIQSLALEHDVPVRFSHVTAGRSDHSSFAARDVAAVHFFTGFHSDYHMPSDIPQKLDYSGLRRIVDLVESLSRAAVAPPAPL